MTLPTCSAAPAAQSSATTKANPQVNRLRALAGANGGGLAGFAKGTILRLEAANLLTAQDRDRLTALTAHMLASAGPGTSQDAAMSQLRQMHDTIVNDPASTPLALGMASVALDSVTQAARQPQPATICRFKRGSRQGWPILSASVWEGSAASRDRSLCR